MSEASKSIDIPPDELRYLAAILREACSQAAKTNEERSASWAEAVAFVHGWKSCCEAMERIADAQPPLVSPPQGPTGRTDGTGVAP